mmetsp:Transcript_46226/g.104772  ORF Transcript_46226/g.104772 Transcript_46226/m.104772 type:complete len:214 (-) Transcript_46226:254-895(-)
MLRHQLLEFMSIHSREKYVAVFAQDESHSRRAAEGLAELAVEPREHGVAHRGVRAFGPGHVQSADLMHLTPLRLQPVLDPGVKRKGLRRAHRIVPLGQVNLLLRVHRRVRAPDALLQSGHAGAEPGDRWLLLFAALVLGWRSRALLRRRGSSSPYKGRGVRARRATAPIRPVEHLSRVQMLANGSGHRGLLPGTVQAHQHRCRVGIRRGDLLP